MSGRRRGHSRSFSILAVFVVVAVLAAARSGAAQPYTFTTLAGTASIGNADGTGSAARFYFPTGTAVDAAGNVFVADGYNGLIRRITPAGVVTTFVDLDLRPQALAVDAAGTVYVAAGDSTILKITAAGVVTTFAGTAYQYGSADGTGSAARFSGPQGIAVDAGGTVYVGDTGNHTIRRITSAGVVTTVAGLAGSTGSADGVGANARFNSPMGVAVDGWGTIFVADKYNSTIRRITAAGEVATLAGLARSTGSVDGVGSGARFTQPRAIAIDGAGTLWVGDGFGHTIRRVTQAGAVATIAGRAYFEGSADGFGADARFRYPDGIAVAPTGDLYVADYDNHIIRKVTQAGVVTTFAGMGPGSVDGTGSAARFMFPEGIAVTADGITYVADSYNSTIRRVAPDGTVSTLAGLAGVGGPTDGTGSAARFGIPKSIEVGPGGVVYVLDRQYSNVRMITPAGVVTTLVTLTGYSNVSGLAVDGAGTVYVSAGQSIVKFSPGGVVTTLAGHPTSYGSTDGVGTAARFFGPQDLAVDSAGNVYVAEYSNSIIRKITPAGVVTTLAGLAGVCYTMDGTGSAARFCSPQGIAVDDLGNLYVSENQSIQPSLHVIRKITPAGVVTTLTASGGFSTDSTSGAARMAVPTSVAVDGRRNLYIADHTSIRLGAIVLDQNVRPGQPAQFILATGGTPAFQWQVSIDNGATWGNVVEGFPYFGSTTRRLAVATTVAELSGTRYRCVITDSVGSATSNVATLTIGGAAVNPQTLSFGGTKGAGDAAFTHLTPPQDVTVTVLTPATGWSATSDQPWVQVTGGSGTGNGRFTVAIVNPGNVIGGHPLLAATVTVTSTDAGSTPFLLPVTLRVAAPGTTGSPFGTFDTPVDGATGVQGSIAVTGWALDDVAVDRVEIWRDLAPGETTPPFQAPGDPRHGKVFIATTLFVEGARPDVETAYAQTPRAQRAGWGYLLLTWGLWQQGNGPVTLYAFAFDADGHATTLGTKAITVSNATANKPFGALDTPTYGQTVTGPFWNYGWALTPNAGTATCRVTNGNVWMGIDSGPLVPVSYGDLRTDIAASFPGFSNGTNAGGAYYLDTAGLTNGTHQIGWYVVDDCGRADGIGSRFFTVLNGATDAPAVTTNGQSAVASAASGGPQRSGARSDGADDRPASQVSTAGVRRNLGDVVPVVPAADGTIVVAVAQGERVEVHLPARDGQYAGAQVVNGERRALPLGSSLDAAGIFYWQPAAGFLGVYELAFAAAGGEARVRIVVGPPLRMAIDTPQSGAVVQPFTLAGWALDLAAQDGSGIDAVHVWAHAVDGRAPIFVGHATFGGSRPDVAATYGPAFERSAFDQIVNGLPVGTYDLVAYAHRAATGSFDAALSVRLVVR